MYYPVLRSQYRLAAIVEIWGNAEKITKSAAMSLTFNVNSSF